MKLDDSGSPNDVRKVILEEILGVFPTIAIDFDLFGHTRSLVQIIKKFGHYEDGAAGDIINI